MALMLTTSTLSSSSSSSSISIYTAIQNPKTYSFPDSQKPQKVLSWLDANPKRRSAAVKALSQFPPKGRSGVLDRPNFDQSLFETLTQTEQGGDIGRFKDKKSLGSGESYRVLLVDDILHTEKLVVCLSIQWLKFFL
uniref:Uncharacterized protein n=1 Tax=Kalanchoe fedtschenkoi TaxID=63787 RepID=A0A7N0V9M9_KALFE